MSHSRRRTPIRPTTQSSSEKYEKRLANRRLRSRVKKAVRIGAELVPITREISDPWWFTKDGKTYVERRDRRRPHERRAMRK